MCIVIVKSKDKNYPSLDNIIRSCGRNPDGFSMAWAYHGRLQNYQTMNMNDFINKYKEIMQLPKEETALILHARIATHGSVSLKNCHCWIKNGFAFAHNGVLNIKPRGDMTDSQTFFEDYFLPAYEEGGWRKAQKIINKKLGWSKFAFLDRRGNVTTYGNFISDEGCLYSNGSYQSNRATMRTPDMSPFFDVNYCGDDYDFFDFFNN